MTKQNLLKKLSGLMSVSLFDRFEIKEENIMSKQAIGIKKCVESAQIPTIKQKPLSLFIKSR